ncbi:Mob1/phocein [Aureobasidium pullulans]|nr:Mob1/phocein [Aureobasidium pullulans]
MASWISNMRGFGRQSNKTQQPKPNTPSPTMQSPANLAPGSSHQMPLSPGLSATAMSFESREPTNDSLNHNQRPPFFFREQYANLIVKGNFMTLAAKPVLVEEGEWLAHQIVEQNRLLDGMLKIIQEADRNTGVSICNQQSCPAMSAGAMTYTWLDAKRESVRVPAPQYISYVQKWIAGKITDPSIFPTDTFISAPPSLSASDPSNWLGKASGFPPQFANDIRNIYRQMLRCYAHIYHAHWLEFWHLGAYKELNTCFIHFVNVGRLFNLLGDKELEPMAPLLDIWLEKGWMARPGSSSGLSTKSSNQSQQQQQQQQQQQHQ